MEKSPRMSRRTFLQGIGGALAAACMPKQAKALGEGAEGIIKEFSYSEEADFDPEAVNKIILSSKTVSELTEGEFRQITALVQRLFKDLCLQNNLHALMRKLHGDKIGKETKIIIRDKSSFNLEGRFFHGDGPENPNKVLVRSDTPVARLVSLLFHESSHGVYGPGETRAESLTLVAMMWIFAKYGLTCAPAILKETRALALWDETLKKQSTTEMLGKGQVDFKYVLSAMDFLTEKTAAGTFDIEHFSRKLLKLPNTEDGDREESLAKKLFGLTKDGFDDPSAYADDVFLDEKDSTAGTSTKPKMSAREEIQTNLESFTADFLRACDVILSSINPDAHRPVRLLD